MDTRKWYGAPIHLLTLSMVKQGSVIIFLLAYFTLFLKELLCRTFVPRILSFLRNLLLSLAACTFPFKYILNVTFSELKYIPLSSTSLLGSPYAKNSITSPAPHQHKYSFQILVFLSYFTPSQSSHLHQQWLIKFDSQFLLPIL